MKNKRVILLFIIMVICSIFLGGCNKKQEQENKYTKEKIGVTVQIIYIGWDKYTDNMQTIMNTGKDFDLAFTSSWANDYLSNSQRGYFMSIDELLPLYGNEMYQSIDPKFWDAAKVDGKTYGVPNEKELGYMLCGYLQKNM